jgi:hypothetical protein
MYERDVGTGAVLDTPGGCKAAMLGAPSSNKSGSFAFVVMRVASSLVEKSVADRRPVRRSLGCFGRTD